MLQSEPCSLLVSFKQWDGSNALPARKELGLDFIEFDNCVYPQELQGTRNSVLFGTIGTIFGTEVLSLNIRLMLRNPAE